MTDHDILGRVVADLREHVIQVLEQTHETNQRLSTLETHIAVLRWALFGAGSIIVGILGYIIRMHIQ